MNRAIPPHEIINGTSHGRYAATGPDFEFIRRRVQLINSEGVLRIREIRQEIRLLFPPVNQDMRWKAEDLECCAEQIDLNCNFLLDMFGVEPLPSVSVENKQPQPPKGVA
jgi:hypothetical protein